MTDHEAWEHGVIILRDLYEKLPHHMQHQLGILLDRYRQYKNEMLTLTLAAGSEVVCRDCNGQCCLNGKYRINGVDVLATLNGQSALPLPDFAAKPLCPYGSPIGCSMQPPFRPLDCVLFICDAVEQRLDDAALTMLASREHNLHGILKQAETLLGKPLGQPLLLLAEQWDSHAPKHLRNTTS